MEVRNRFFIKVVILSILTLLMFFQWAPTIISSLYNGLLDEKTSITDYYYFHYSFENVWHNQPSDWLYDCRELQRGLKEKFNIDSPPNACYLYPPHFAVFLSWLGFFDFVHAEYIWNVLLNFLYLIGIILFLKLIFKEKSMKSYKFIITLAFLLSLLHYPFLFDSQMSNSNRLTFFFISVMFYLKYKKKKDFLAGLPLGFAIVFKITPAIILLFYLFKRNFKIALGTLFSMVFSTMVVILTVGWKVLWEFATEDFWGFSSKLLNFSVPYDNSIQGILTTYSPNIHSKTIFVIYIILIFILYISLLQNNQNQNVEIGLLALSPLVFSPHLEVHHLILTIFAQIILVYYLCTNKQKGIIKIVLIILCVISFFIFTFIDFWTAKGEHFLGLMIILLSLILIHINRRGLSLMTTQFFR